MKKIMYFSAEWCGPCKSFGPIMEQIKMQIPVEKVDIDKLPHLAQAYNVRSVPTTIILRNNQEVRRFVGAQTKTIIMESFNSL